MANKRQKAWEVNLSPKNGTASHPTVVSNRNRILSDVEDLDALKQTVCQEMSNRREGEVCFVFETRGGFCGGEVTVEVTKLS